MMTYVTIKTLHQMKYPQPFAKNYLLFIFLLYQFFSKYIYIYIYVGSRPQLIGFIRFGEPVPHGLSARPRVWAGPTKG